MIKAGIIGSTGYAGQELVRLLMQHPDVEIEYLGIPGNAADAKNKLEMAFSANAASW